MSSLIHDFYVQPMNQVYMETIAVYLIWTAAMLLLRGKARSVLAIIGAALSIWIIFLLTIFGRSGGGDQGISLIPFITFVNAKAQPELYRTMYMNMLLFLPFGLSLPFVMQKKMRHPILATILSAFGMSACIEIVQYVFHLGKCETDDVIMNVLGAAIGTTAFLICRLRASRKA